MSNTRTIILSTFVTFAFAFGCDTIFADIKRDSTNDFIAHNKTKAYANFCTGYYLMLEGQWEEAIVFLKKALQSNPNAEKIHNSLAASYYQLNKKDEALFHIERIAQLKPHDFSIHYTLGGIYESEGKERNAISEYERASNCVMDDINKIFVADMLHRLANLYIKSNDLEKATNVCKKILDAELTNEPAKIHYKLGQIYFERKMIKEAIGAFAKARNYDSKFESISFHLALCYEQLEDYEKAIAELKSFIEGQSDVWFVHISLSDLYKKVRQDEMAELEREKAFDILKESISNGSKDIRSYVVLSQLFQEKGKNREAVETLKNAISNVISNEDDEPLIEIHLLLANIYYEMNEYKDVVKVLRDVLVLDPDCHQANNFLGYFFVERGERLDEAISLIEKALSFKPNNGAYLDSLGWAYYKLANNHDDEKLMIALQKLVEASKYAEDPEIMEHIGDVNYSLGFWEEAQRQWMLALERWEKISGEKLSHIVNENSREFKAIRMLRKKLEKLKDLKVVEDSAEKPKTGKRVVSNLIQ